MMRSGLGGCGVPALIPLDGQLIQAAQGEAGAPLGLHRLGQAQRGDAPNQGGEDHGSFDTRKLGTEAEMNAAAERQRL